MQSMSIVILVLAILAAVLAPVHATVNFPPVSLAAGSVSTTLKHPAQPTAELVVSETAPMTIRTTFSKHMRHVYITLQDSVNLANTFTLPLDFQGTTYILKADFTSERILNQINGIPGHYNMTLYAVDFDHSYASYPLGSVHLAIKDSFETHGRTAIDGEQFTVLDEIEHVFKPNPKEGRSTLSMVFSAMVLAPWVVLLGYWFSLGVNVSNMFVGAGFTFYGLMFMGVLDAWLLLFYFYFTVFNLFQLLGYGSILGLITLVIGRQALVEKTKLA